jgi:hypothetical protein
MKLPKAYRGNEAVAADIPAQVTNKQTTPKKTNKQITGFLNLRCAMLALESALYDASRTSTLTFSFVLCNRSSASKHMQLESRVSYLHLHLCADYMRSLCLLSSVLLPPPCISSLSFPRSFNFELGSAPARRSKRGRFPRLGVPSTSLKRTRTSVLCPSRGGGCQTFLVTLLHGRATLEKSREIRTRWSLHPVRT